MIAVKRGAIWCEVVRSGAISWFGRRRQMVATCARRWHIGHANGGGQWETAQGKTAATMGVGRWEMGNGKWGGAVGARWRNGAGWARWPAQPDANARFEHFDQHARKLRAGRAGILPNGIVFLLGSTASRTYVGKRVQGSRFRVSGREGHAQVLQARSRMRVSAGGTLGSVMFMRVEKSFRKLQKASETVRGRISGFEPV